MKIINVDILSLESGVICQQVNCQGKFNAGLAKQTREKYPIVYEVYKSFCDLYNDDKTLLLGSKLPIKVKDDLCFVLLFGQFNYGREKKIYTDNEALNKSLSELHRWVNGKVFRYRHPNSLPVYFPYKMGCGLGGGDWLIVEKILEKHFPEGVICKL